MREIPPLVFLWLNPYCIPILSPFCLPVLSLHQPLHHTNYPDATGSVCLGTLFLFFVCRYPKPLTSLLSRCSFVTRLSHWSTSQFLSLDEDENDDELYQYLSPRFEPTSHAACLSFSRAIETVSTSRRIRDWEPSSDRKAEPVVPGNRVRVTAVEKLITSSLLAFSP